MKSPAGIAIDGAGYIAIIGNFGSNRLWIFSPDSQASSAVVVEGLPVIRRAASGWLITATAASLSSDIPI